MTDRGTQEKVCLYGSLLLFYSKNMCHIERVCSNGKNTKTPYYKTCLKIIEMTFKAVATYKYVRKNNIFDNIQFYGDFFLVLSTVYYVILIHYLLGSLFYEKKSDFCKLNTVTNKRTVRNPIYSY